jgi:hypothetical protein
LLGSKVRLTARANRIRKDAHHQKREVMMKSETKNSRGLCFSRIIAPLAFALSLFCFVATATQKHFYIQPGAENPGTFKPPVIEVKSTRDPAVYDRVDVKQGSGSDLKFSLQVRGQCDEKYRLEEGHISIGSKNQTRVAFPVNKDHRSIGPDHGQGWDYFSFVIPFRMPDIGRSPVDVCNTELKRAGSLSARAKLLRDGFDIDFARAYKADLSIQCHREVHYFFEDPNPYIAYTDLPAVIRCMPTGFKPHRTAVPEQPPQRSPVPDPPIESVSVLADPAETQGKQCPVNVTFRGKITAGENSAYAIFKTKYRFIGENNFKTDWAPVSVARGESRSVIWRRYIQAPVNDPTGALKTPGGKVKIPVYRGWMAIEVMLPNGDKRSERTPFSVDCNVQPRFKSRS